MASVTIESVLDGAKVEIGIEEAADDAAVIIVKTWAKANPPGPKPQKTDKIDLYDVRRVKGSDAIFCKAKAPGPDPTVTCTLEAGSGVANRSVEIDVKAWFGSRKESYAISDASYQAGLAFLTQADFPVT